MRVRLSKAAQRDLDEILSHVAKDSVRNALSLVGELQDAALELGDAPLSYPVLFEAAAIRRRPVGRYNIYYSVRDVVEVVRILHSARKANRRPFSEP